MLPRQRPPLTLRERQDGRQTTSAKRPIDESTKLLITLLIRNISAPTMPQSPAFIYVALCGNDDDNLLNKAYLMSFKALSEHYLSSGDSATDLNQANALLVECQTHPGFYGTHTGAQCETQENNNIRTQTNWEMQNY
jgi:hypothetical protein